MKDPNVELRDEPCNNQHQQQCTFLEYPVPKGSINVRSSEDLDVKRQKREN
jgi:hypothetical protein